MRAAILLVAAAILGAGQALAHEVRGDTAAGYAFAARVCAACHVISPSQVDDPAVGAPSFSAVAADPAATALSLGVFLRSPHERMPDLILSDREIDDVIAYILSLE